MIKGLKTFPARRFDDERGFFTELYNEFLPGIPQDLKFNLGQVNISFSKQGTIRGMHYQTDPPMAKYFRLIKGSILLVELDIRKKSPTYGETEKFFISDKDPYAVWIPYGFANGFIALEDSLIGYVCTGNYNPSTECAISPLSPELMPIWSEAYPDESSFIISDKDKSAPIFVKSEKLLYIE
jgi:dTDP-4-dehydrorhamnose 3,5-epimerase